MGTVFKIDYHYVLLATARETLWLLIMDVSSSFGLTSTTRTCVFGVVVLNEILYAVVELSDLKRLAQPVSTHESITSSRAHIPSIESEAATVELKDVDSRCESY